MRKDGSKPVSPPGEPRTGDPQRPDMVPLAKTGYMFHHVGSSGWGNPRREVSEYKDSQGWSEADFAHLDELWSGEDA